MPTKAKYCTFDYFYRRVESLMPEYPSQAHFTISLTTQVPQKQRQKQLRCSITPSLLNLHNIWEFAFKKVFQKVSAPRNEKPRYASLS